MAAITPPTGPNPLSAALLASVAPDYQTNMLEAQRRLAMAQALQQQSMTDTPGNGGSVSWTQGLARILQAFAAQKMAKNGYSEMRGANQALGQSFGGLAGGYAPGTPQTAQGAPTDPSAVSAPQTPPQAPPAASQPFVPGQAPTPGQVDPLAPLPNAPPQAAPQPPSAPPSQSTGGAPQWQPGPFALTGTPEDRALMFAPGYIDAVLAKAAKGATPTDTEVLMNHARILASQGDYQGAAMLAAQAQKAGYIPPVSGRPGGWTIFPDGHREYNPTAPAPGSMPIMDNGQPTGKWTEDPSVAAIQAQQAGAVAGAQAGAKAPYDVIQIWDPNRNAFVNVPKSAVTGGFGSSSGGPLTHYYGASGGLQSSPSLGAQAAAEQYGKGSANAFLDTQDIAENSPQRVQALREMQTLLSGPNGLNTGPTAAKFQQLAEEHGLPFGYSNNAFVFNKDAARFVAQSAQDLGLNGSDARLGMMANASPNMKMTPQALSVVIPTMIGLEYAKMAKATAASTWAQHSPGTNAQFESTWRQAYDPRMFTAYAQGGVQALAKAPANVRAQWLRDYRTLKGMGVDFTQFAQ